MVSVENMVNQVATVAEATDALRAALDDCGPALRAVLVAGIDLTEKRRLVSKDHEVLALRGPSPIPNGVATRNAVPATNGKYASGADAIRSVLAAGGLPRLDIMKRVVGRFATKSKKPTDIIDNVLYAMKRDGKIKQSPSGVYTLA